MSQFPADPAVPPRIDREIADGDELGFGDDADGPLSKPF